MTSTLVYYNKESTSVLVTNISTLVYYNKEINSVLVTNTSTLVYYNKESTTDEKSFMTQAACTNVTQLASLKISWSVCLWHAFQQPDLIFYQEPTL